MIAKTNEAWQLSDNLGTDGGAFRVIGTQISFQRYVLGDDAQQGRSSRASMPARRWLR